MASREEHESVIGPIVDAYRDRRSRREKHPVHDFLFEYFQVNRKVLRSWYPSGQMELEGQEAEVFLGEKFYEKTEGGVRLDYRKLSDRVRRCFVWVASLLRAAQARPPRFNCFGLHEWAMVYKSDEVRHESTPLRLSPEAVEAVVESSPIRCSHFDAFRFFTPAAAPLNELQPEREGREKFEQFGCVHFNMDLYRWCSKLSPWVGSDLLRDCFLLALEARELDMRASPYELSEYGYESIRIETAPGREAYAAQQQVIYRKGQVLAKRLLDECDFSLEMAGWVTDRA